MYTLFTAGYTSFADTSGHPSVDVFVKALKAFNIGALVDVRSMPYGSDYYADYSKEKLHDILLKTGICYLHFGEQFGARPTNRDLYVNGRADFEKMSSAPAFIDGCRRIALVALGKMNVCLMCSEKDPLTCHRTILVSRRLSLRHHDVRILHMQYGEGRGKKDVLPERPLSCGTNHLFAETQSDVDTRLLQEEGLIRKNGMRQLSLFAPENTKDLLVQAYRQRELRIAWKEQTQEESFE